MGFLSSIYNSAQSNIPLNQRDIVDLSPGLLGLGAEGSRAVNFQSILKTGEASVFRYNHSEHAQYIDWNSDDAFTRAITAVEQRSIERIQSDPELQQLLLKEQWDKSDRTTWEKKLSGIVSEEHFNVPGLAEYRNVVFDEYKGVTNTRALRLNDLATDIENNTKTIEHDCESMSIFEGVVLQKIENNFFANPADEERLKGAANYFYTTGVKGDYDSFKNNYGHAFIISSATGNVIEATNPSQSAYRENVNPDYSFESFVRGQASYNKGGHVYAPYGTDARDIVDNKIQHGFLKNVDSIYEDVGYLIKGQVADPFDALSSAPPEIAGLVDIRERIMDLEKEMANPSWASNPEKIISRIDGYKNMFNREIENLKDTGGIEPVAQFINSEIGADMIDAGHKYDQVMHALHEMYAKSGPEELQTRINQTFATGIPNIDGQSFDDYESFIEARVKKDFSMIDNVSSYEDSYGAYKTDPTSELARPYDNVRAFVMMQYPDPDDPLSRHNVLNNMNAVLADYKNFTSARDANTAVETDHQQRYNNTMGQPAI